MKATSGVSVPYRVGEWLPSDHAHLEKWLEAVVQKTNTEERVLHPVIADFQDLIESDAEIFMLFNQMFKQVPRKPPYNKDPSGKSQVRTYCHMLQLLNTILTHAPEFNESGLVGCLFDSGAAIRAGCRGTGLTRCYLNDRGFDAWRF
jgi:phosphatidylserine decarboxylase